MTDSPAPPPLTTAATPPPAPPPDPSGPTAAARRLLDEVERAVVGKRAALELILAGLLAGGHVLLDDVPGVAKTLSAKSLASAAGLRFARVQFTPDVMPSDITGYTALDPATNAPVFRPGPVFAQLVLADEINRSPAKTQAALLEAMSEQRVTLDGVTHDLPSPFLVVATQNPVESEGTYPLPEAQLDRFILRTSIGYPSAPDERELLQRRLARRTEQPALDTVLTSDGFSRLQDAVESVEVHPTLVDYIVSIVQATRADPQLALGSSPRGGLAMLKVARAVALLAGRAFVTPDDVRAIVIPTLSHRVLLTDDAWARGADVTAVVQTIADSIPAPITF